MDAIDETLSQTESDFIRKLLKMIYEHPNIINYSEDGTELVILDKKQFLDDVLKNHFRHSNWRSFVRQLNMYSFKKINRGLNQEIFVNAIFKRGNEQNFHKIKRKKNPRDNELQREREIEDKTNFLLRQNIQSKPQLEEFVRQIFIIKRKSQEPIQKLKNAIEKLAHKRKNKETKPYLTQLQESFQLLDRSSEKLFNAAEIFNKKMEKKDNRIQGFKSNSSIMSFFIEQPMSYSIRNLEFKQEEDQKQNMEEKKDDFSFSL